MSPSTSPSSVAAPALWSITWPLLVNMALTFSLNVVDSFFLSRHSDEAAAAVGALFPALALTAVLFSAIGQAGCSVAGQLIGAGRHQSLPLTYLALVGVNVLLGVLASIGFISIANALPTWLNLQGATAVHARTYLLVVGGTQVFKALHMAYANILYSKAKTAPVARSAVVANLSNVGLNALFLSGYFQFLPSGVLGVAWATVASTVLSVLWLMHAVHRGLGIRFTWAASPEELRARLRPILAIGVPSALEPVAYQATQVAITLIVAGFGTIELAARIYTFNLYVMSTILWSIALGTGTQILVARCIGARAFEAADQQLRQSMLWGACGSLLIVLVMLWLQPLLVGVLTDDPRIIAATRPLFIIGIFVELGRAFNIIAGGALRSSGDARFVSFVGIAMMVSIGLPICYLLGVGLKLGLTGIWIGLAIDECTRGAVNWTRWKSGHWRRFAIVEPEAEYRAERQAA